MRTELRYICGDKVENIPDDKRRSCKCNTSSKKTLKVGSLAEVEYEVDDGEFIEKRIQVNWGLFCDECAQKIIDLITSLRK